MADSLSHSFLAFGEYRRGNSQRAARCQVKLVSSPLPSYPISGYFLIKRLLRHALSEISLMANLCNYVRGSGILCVYAGGVLRH
jgi:hypothetical protein